MEDADLRALFRDVQSDVQELRKMLNGMQLYDAESRADAKIVASKLDSAAAALSSAAVAMQSRHSAGAISPHEKWLLRIIVGLLAAILALAGIRTIDPALFKILG